MSFQSALMSWRDNGFDRNKISSERARKVDLIFDKLEEEKFGAVQESEVQKRELIKDIQRIEQSLRDTKATFYYKGTVYDSTLSKMMVCADKWMEVVAEEVLINLEDIEEKLQEIKG